MSYISVCTRCGTDIDPVDYRDAEGSDIWRSYCDRCNADFEESMRHQFPHGQCNICGAAYDASGFAPHAEGMCPNWRDYAGEYDPGEEKNERHDPSPEYATRVQIVDIDF